MNLANPTARTPDLLTSAWPYVLGAAAGLVIAGAMLVMLASITVAVPPWLVTTSVHALAAATMLLGVAWVGLFRHGVGTAVASLGSFALGGALVFLRLHPDGEPEATAALLMLGLAAFAAGLACVRGLGAPRVLAAVACGCLSSDLVAASQASERLGALALPALLTLGAATLLLPFSLLSLRASRATT